MGEPAENTMIVVIGCALASIVLLALGIWRLRRADMLGRRGALIGWVVLWIALMLLPLFGGGLFLYTRHQVERATGEIQPGGNEPGARAAPP